MVYRAIDRQYNTLCAIKHTTLPTSNLLAGELIQEFELLKSLDHPNILRLIEGFRNSKEICLVTELCEGKSLVDAINECDISESEAAYIIF